MAVTVSTKAASTSNINHGVAGNDAKFVFAVSGGNISNTGYHLEINIYASDQTTLLSGPFQFYKDSNDDVTVILDTLLADLIDIKSETLFATYSLRYQEKWDAGSETAAFVASPATYKALFGYESSGYADYQDTLPLQKILKVWGSWPFTWSYLVDADSSNPSKVKANFENGYSEYIIDLNNPVEESDNLEDFTVGETVTVGMTNEALSSLTGWSQEDVDGNAWAVVTGVQAVSVPDGESTHILYQKIPATAGNNVVYTVDISGGAAASATIKLLGIVGTPTGTISDWDEIAEIPHSNSSESGTDAAGLSYNYIGVVVTNNSGSAQTYTIAEMEVDTVVSMNRISSLVLEPRDNGDSAIFDQDYEFEAANCGGVMLKWVNSLGGVDQWLFNNVHDKGYEFDRGGNKYLTQILYVDGLTLNQWESIQEIFKDGEIYEANDLKRYRNNHQVWQVSQTGTDTPVIVKTESVIVRSDQKGISMSVEIQYPKEIIV